MNAATANIIVLPLSALTLDEDLQPRARIDRQTKEDYVYAIADGMVLPPVTVVFDGEKHWLADGYHRFYAHQTLGATEITADVRRGNALDAVRISLSANAEHGKRREPGDYSKAYGIAVRFGLVDEKKTDGIVERVIALLRCSVRWAESLTKAARDSAKAARQAEAQRLKQEGKSNREIAAELGVSKETVRTVLVSGEVSGQKTQAAFSGHLEGEAEASEGAPSSGEGRADDEPPAAVPAEPRAGETEAKDEDAPPPSPPSDPYAGIRDTFSERGQRWHRALEALRLVNEQADPSAMFAERYTGVDHAIGPELQRAHAWINELHRRFSAV